MEGGSISPERVLGLRFRPLLGSSDTKLDFNMVLGVVSSVCPYTRPEWTRSLWQVLGLVTVGVPWWHSGTGQIPILGGIIGPCRVLGHKWLQCTITCDVRRVLADAPAANAWWCIGRG
jgi:hypothetical protein